MMVESPGVVKFFGEHSVVKDRLAVAMAIDRYATARISKTGANTLTINLADSGFNKSMEFDSATLLRLYNFYSIKEKLGSTDAKNKYINSFIEQYRDVDQDIRPLAVIAARMHSEFGDCVLGKTVTIRSNIPVQKGFASSAACSTAFTASMLDSAGIKLGDTEIIDIAREGERVRHANDGAGGIDVSTSYYGGFVSYRKSDGAHKENIDASVKLLVIDTGSKKPTSEMVKHFGELVKGLGNRANEVLDKFDQCSKEGIEALRKNDIETVGRLMYKNQDLLKYMEMSNEGLDIAVEIAKKNGAYGAKLSGGGGGGIAIALAKDPDRLMDIFKSRGYDSYIVSKNVGGTKSRASLKAYS